MHGWLKQNLLVLLMHGDVFYSPEALFALKFSCSVKSIFTWVFIWLVKCSVLSKISSPHIGVKGLFLTPVRLYVTQRFSSLTPRLKMIGGKGEHEHDSGVGDGGGEGREGGKEGGLIVQRLFISIFAR